jgi:hypothetical protein
VVQCVEGFLVQFVVMRLPLSFSAIWGGLGGNSMGLILDARNVSFQDLRVAFFWLWPSGWGWGKGWSCLVEQARFIKPYVQVMK